MFSEYKQQDAALCRVDVVHESSHVERQPRHDGDRVVIQVFIIVVFFPEGLRIHLDFVLRG